MRAWLLDSAGYHVMYDVPPVILCLPPVILGCNELYLHLTQALLSTNLNT